MTKKELISFIFIDFLVIATILFLFYYFEKRTAGLIGGALFLAQGFYFVVRISKWDKMTSTATFYGVMAHLFLATVPVIILRLSHFSTPFSQIVLGPITGPGIHKFAETIYLVLIISHIVDLVKLQFGKKVTN